MEAQSPQITKSLNDPLLVGTKLQQDLVSILTRFRTFQYVLNADITKMYREIQIYPEHADYTGWGIVYAHGRNRDF
jgi:hypothetical protein